jgi:DNA adenine methylase
MPSHLRKLEACRHSNIREEQEEYGKMPEPILKWAGGKRGLISNILSLFPRDYKSRTYHEPFFGGGALFFTIAPKRGSINDINPRLINFYKVVRDHPEELIKQASQYPYEKEAFYQIREHYNKANLNNIEDGAITLYLNKTAFNGLYRVNSKGEFNVPFGRYNNPTIVDKERIRTASKLLKHIEILQTDFSYLVEKAEKEDLVYFDPPYLPVSDTANFTSYSSDGFSWDDQIRLRDICIKLHEKGVLFVLSNSYIQKLIDYYKDTEDFRILTVKANRAINSKGAKRGPVSEALITNIPESFSVTSKKLTNFIEN